MTRSVPTSTFFPVTRPGEQPDLSPGVIERVTLVLTGVDPVILENGPAKDALKKQRVAGFSLQDLRRDPNVNKVSPSKSLSEDHRAILWPYFQLTEKAFAETWQNSKTVPGAQESTLLIKKIHKLKKMDVAQNDSEWARRGDDLKAIAEDGSKILFYLFRTAMRRVDRDCGEPAPAKTEASFFTRLVQKLTKSAPPESPLVHFPASVLRETETYVETALKLNRLLTFVGSLRKRERA